MKRTRKGRTKNKENNIALFIGRFQPFHNGHLHVIKQLSRKYKKVIIAVGSAQHKNTKENPLSFQERKEIIDGVLKKNSIFHYKIVAVSDIPKDNQWVHWLCAKTGPFNHIYSGNAFVRFLFRQAKFKPHPIKEISKISATIIRKRIGKGL